MAEGFYGHTQLDCLFLLDDDLEHCPMHSQISCQNQQHVDAMSLQKFKSSQVVFTVALVLILRSLLFYLHYQTDEPKKNMIKTIIGDYMVASLRLREAPTQLRHRETSAVPLRQF